MRRRIWPEQQPIPVSTHPYRVLIIRAKLVNSSRCGKFVRSDTPLGDGVRGRWPELIKSISYAALLGVSGLWRRYLAAILPTVPQCLTACVADCEGWPQAGFGQIEARRTGASKSRCHTGAGRYPSLVIRSYIDEISPWACATLVIQIQQRLTLVR